MKKLMIILSILFMAGVAATGCRRDESRRDQAPSTTQQPTPGTTTPGTPGTTTPGAPGTTAPGAPETTGAPKAVEPGDTDDEGTGAGGTRGTGDTGGATGTTGTTGGDTDTTHRDEDQGGGR